MLAASAFAEREVELQVCIQGVCDTAKGCQPRLVLSAFESSYRWLRDSAAPRQLCLRKAVLGPESDELACNLLVRLELLERCLVLRILL